MRPHHFIVSAILGLVLAACASAQPVEGGGGDCATKRTAIIDRVNKVLEQQLACSTAADCVSIGYGNSCFDACSRSVSKAGVDAVNAALKSPENNECAGCPVVAPPCAPPSAPACVAGKCQ
ncbi:MAG: hypothetical protein U0359_21400 [Byssovorax sp.]